MKKHTSATSTPPQKRLESLDILRGFDLFLLVAFQPLFMYWARVEGENSFVGTIFQKSFTHVEWEGFHLWDQIMPLFLFMAGTSIPYAFSKYRKQPIQSQKGTLLRILKRVFLLWLFGAIIQGNLLDLDPSKLYLYTDTLQAIAMGYFFSVLFFLYLPSRLLLPVFLILPFIYTLGMLFTGGYVPGENLAEQIDKALLGRFLYGASVTENGSVLFADWYHISWIYSTLNFTATVMSGVLTGKLLRSNATNKKKIYILGSSGLLFIGIALGFTSIEPIIKRLWTSSMMFLSSGISILLMLLFYYWIDIRKKGASLKWLKVYGMNSILSYMLYHTLNSTSLRTYWLHGFKPYLGEYYDVLFEFAHVSIVFLILYYCYKARIFLKV